MRNNSTIRKGVPLLDRALLYFSYSISWYPIYIAFLIFLRMQTKGGRHIPLLRKRDKRSLLFVSNHISELDGMASASALPPFFPYFPIFWVGMPGKFYKSSEFSWRRYIYGNLFMKLVGVQPIVPGTHDYAQALQRHIWLLKHGYSVCIFPEGSFRKEKKRIHGGAGYLMETCNPLVIPVRISGVEGITMKEFFTFKRRLKVEYGKPLEPRDLLNPQLPVPERYRDAVKKVMDKILSNEPLA